ncbi:MAG TPA: polymer-forming cytoskeletal protein [Candidatus Limnocylindria bacterium]
MAQKIEETPDPMPETLEDGKLRFEGKVELGGTVTGQMLGILFGPDSDVDGRLQYAGPVHIDGTFRGAIKTNDALVVGDHATIDADVSCGSAVIRGTIVGNITATESVALEGRAHVKGDITAPSLAMAKGTMFDGTSRMGTLPSPKRSGRR